MTGERVPTHYLYIDESGDFGPRQSWGRRPCVIGGFLAQSSATEDAAWNFLADVAGHERDACFHAQDRTVQADRAGWVAKLPSALAARRWSVALFEHSSGREVIDNATTYLNVLAEGVVQLLLDLAAEFRGSPDPLRLELLLAERWLPRPDDPSIKDMTPQEAYVLRLRERFAVEQVRQAALLGRRLELGAVELGSARGDPRLMVADLVCGVWRFRDELDAKSIEGIEEVVGSRCYSALRPVEASRIRDAIARGDLAAAMHDLVVTDAEDSEAVADRKRVLDRLAALTTEGRERELDGALARVDERSTARLSVDAIADIARRWRERIVAPLRDRLAEGDRWLLSRVEARLLWNVLTAANHSGSLSKARSALHELEEFRRAIPANFSNFPLELEIALAEAVHRTDALDLERACTAMRKVADDLEPILSMLGSLWGRPEETTALKSNLLGKTVGTELQAWTRRGRFDRGSYDEARRLSGQALALFPGTDDVRRQAGYRCQLEADAGDWKEAFRWLARAVGAEVADGSAPDPEATLTAASRVSWSVFYWTHVWEATTRADGAIARGVAARCLDAWNKANLVASQRWFGSGFAFPGHLVAWKAGVASVRGGSVKPGLRLLERAAQECFREPDAEVFRFIGLGVLADLAASTDGAQRRGTLNRLARETKALHNVQGLPETLGRELDHWIGELESSEVADEVARLGKLSRRVPY